MQEESKRTRRHTEKLFSKCLGSAAQGDARRADLKHNRTLSRRLCRGGGGACARRRRGRPRDGGREAARGVGRRQGVVQGGPAPSPLFSCRNSCSTCRLASSAPPAPPGSLLLPWHALRPGRCGHTTPTDPAYRPCGGVYKTGTSFGCPQSCACTPEVAPILLALNAVLAPLSPAAGGGAQPGAQERRGGGRDPLVSGSRRPRLGRRRSGHSRDTEDNDAWWITKKKNKLKRGLGSSPLPERDSAQWAWQLPDWQRAGARRSLLPQQIGTLLVESNFACFCCDVCNVL